ncbi:MAG: hypothetical protein D8M57_04795 [Candidatus Scalindua sp. AMX11]|nr:MAG: hypothetical protein DWQ00_03800 [Candidatus Scalindua sp.]NOG84568.1 hypothetical protein [Planctomycetota bacterium]RZV92343.1 MAG: hypothetical protein EX341_04655 [Candidatus Scalindua sp. SCAELEC01]TDE66132.1 MAG: hypothetical protein D8M57_04795 [Candidatus Scalindua sp. AMX11]GJQ59106.1 MAG: hypothetical protein SCALA701_19070 [Candidatus Scalindua sp.]
MLNHIFRYYIVIGISLFLLSNFQLTRGEPAFTMRHNGDSANRVDLVILGDGYTESEMGKYGNDVENLVNGFFSQEPFKEYQNYFNVHRIEVISSESGADHPERGEFKDTVFNATYNCAGIQRLICVNISKVNDILANSLEFNQRDIILVIVNDSEYGGSGGAIAVASTHSAVVELVLHEIGHSFGHLADEYTSSPPTCNNTIEPFQPNVTMETDRNLIKWNVGGGPPTGWIDFTTLIPTTDTTSGIPGLYEGAKYCLTGLYRPTRNSKMRCLFCPFEQINEEALVKRIYNWVSPLDSRIPFDTDLLIQKGKNQLFQIEVPEPLTDPLDVIWNVNGEPQVSDLQFIIDTTNFDIGSHTVEVVIQDSTTKVRNDPLNLLTENHIWNLQINTSSIVNDLVSLDKLKKSFSHISVPGGQAGTITITATFTNTSSIPIDKPFLQVITLSGENVLLNADGGAGEVGATLTPDVGNDHILSPGESVTVVFVIGLQTVNSFKLFVDLRGAIIP